MAEPFSEFCGVSDCCCSCPEVAGDISVSGKIVPVPSYLGVLPALEGFLEDGFLEEEEDELFDGWLEEDDSGEEEAVTAGGPTISLEPEKFTWARAIFWL